MKKLYGVFVSFATKDAGVINTISLALAVSKGAAVDYVTGIAKRDERFSHVVVTSTVEADQSFLLEIERMIMENKEVQELVKQKRGDQ